MRSIYLEHTRWILKVIRRRTHNLTWYGSNLAYVHGERTWKSFINNLDKKRSNLPLDDTRVFTFPLSLPLDNKSIHSFYPPSPCSSLSWLFRALHCYTPHLSFVLLLYLNPKLQSFIYTILQYNSYLDYKMILVIGCLKNLDQSLLEIDLLVLEGF